MSPRTLQIVQNLLLTAVTVVLALVVLTTFMRVIRPADPAAFDTPSDQAGNTTGGGTGSGPGTTGPPGTGGPATSDAPGTTGPGSGQEGPGCSEQGPPDGAGTVVVIYYTCGSGPVPDVSGFVYRRVPATELVLTATMAEMVKGPDADEQELGFTSTFSDATADAIAGLSLESGNAVIDFTGLDGVGDLTRPTRSNALLAELNATVFQFDTIDEVEYRLGGSCDAFWAQLGAECRSITRQDWNRQLAEWRSG